MTVDFDEYQQHADRTSARRGFTLYNTEPPLTPEKNFSFVTRLAAAGLGLVGEGGEVSEHLKKWLTHGHSLNAQVIEKELGDVLYYIAEIATTLNLSLNSIAENNIDKLRKRYGEKFSTEKSINRKE